MRKRHFDLPFLVGLILILGGSLGSSLKTDEVVTFFPTFALKSANGSSWLVNIHAWVYEPEENSITRKTLLHLLSKRLGVTEDQGNSKLFQARAKPFLVDNERGKKVSVRLAGEIFEIGPSSPNGHIVTTLRLPVAKLPQSSPVQPKGSNHLVRVEVEIPGEEGRGFSFEIPFIQPEGVSIISDLDDTIKISEVGDRRALLKNTFCEEFRAVPEMADLYKTWSDRGASFHYVSASPWQLHLPIAEFLKSEGFPSGSMSLKTFRWKDSSFFDLFAKSNEIKKPFIEDILKAFPKRKFILVGDSGEFDPELYSELARSHSEQVKKIFIRNSTEEFSSSRWKQVFDGLPTEMWSIFSEPSQLYGKALELFKE